MYSQESISANIRTLIHNRGLKQRYIAERAGFDEQTFSSMLNGYRPIRAEHIPMIAEALDVTPNELFRPSDAIGISPEELRPNSAQGGEPTWKRYR